MTLLHGTIFPFQLVNRLYPLVAQNLNSYPKSVFGGFVFGHVFFSCLLNFVSVPLILLAVGGRKISVPAHGWSLAGTMKILTQNSFTVKKDGLIK